MKRITAIILILSLLCGIAYSQEKTAQTKPAKTEKTTDPKAGKKEVTFDPKKPTIIMYFDPKNESQVKFVEVVTAGKGNQVNFGAMDVNNEKVQQRLRSLLSQYKRSKDDVWDIICVIGIDYDGWKESDTMLGTKDIAEYLDRFYKYYASPKIFPNKPKLEYPKIETIADKFEQMMKKFELTGTAIDLKIQEYKALATEANEVLQSALENKSDDKTWAMLIMLIAFSAYHIFGKMKNKRNMKKNSANIESNNFLSEEILKLKHENSQIAGAIFDLKNKEEKTEEKTD